MKIIKNGVLIEVAKKDIRGDGYFEIPSGVKEIAKDVELPSLDLKEVNIPEGVKEIGNRAFANCLNLEKVSLPDSVKIIGKSAFEHCESLKEVNFPIELVEIGEDAFANCESLEEVRIPDSVNKIGNYAFRSCHNLKEITFPNNEIEFEQATFLDCCSLKTIYVPENFKFNIIEAVTANCEEDQDIVDEMPYYDCNEELFKSLANLPRGVEIVRIKANEQAEDYKDETTEFGNSTSKEQGRNL